MGMECDELLGICFNLRGFEKRFDLFKLVAVECTGLFAVILTHIIIALLTVARPEGKRTDGQYKGQAACTQFTPAGCTFNQKLES